MSNQLSAFSVRRLLFVAAAGVGALAFIPGTHAGEAVPNPTNPTNPPTLNEPSINQSSQPLVMPAGFVQKDEGADADVRSTMGQLTQRAVAKDSYDSFFSGFLSDLATRDKARAQEFKGADQQHLNDLIGQIQTAWQSKYGHDFDATDKNLAFDEQYPVVQGEVSDPTLAANNWPAAGSAALVTPSTSTEQQACNTKELTEGRAVAIIRLPAGDGLPEMYVSMIHQRLSGWYVVLPVDRTGEQIYNDLSAHLGYIAAHQDLWPAQPTQAYHMVARNVVAALYGVPSQSGTASAQ